MQKPLFYWAHHLRWAALITRWYCQICFIIVRDTTTQLTKMTSGQFYPHQSTTSNTKKTYHASYRVTFAHIMDLPYFINGIFLSITIKCSHWNWWLLSLYTILYHFTYTKTGFQYDHNADGISVTKKISDINGTFRIWWHFLKSRINHWFLSLYIGAGVVLVLILSPRWHRIHLHGINARIARYFSRFR